MSPSTAELIEKMPTAMEKKFFKLRQSEAMLEWADALYRTDEAASIARARELYKGVLFLHNMTPPIRPNWGGVPVKFTLHTPNPAVRSQTKRARRGFNQIELGLNYYGVSDQFVPVLFTVHRPGEQVQRPAGQLGSVLPLLIARTGEEAEMEVRRLGWEFSPLR